MRFDLVVFKRRGNVDKRVKRAREQSRSLDSSRILGGEKREERRRVVAVPNISDFERSTTESPVNFQFVDWKIETKAARL